MSKSVADLMYVPTVPVVLYSYDAQECCSACCFHSTTIG